jgi:hypothetical protein
VTTAHIVKTLTEARPVFEKKPFATAAEAMAQSLFTADGGTSTRRGDLSRVVTVFNKDERGKALSSLRDLLDSVNSIISLDPDASYNARQKVSGTLADSAGLLPPEVK